jgi:hypothetical protein
MASTASKRYRRALESTTPPAARRRRATEDADTEHSRPNGVILVDGSDDTPEQVVAAPPRVTAHQAPGTQVTPRAGKVGLRSSAVVDHIGRLLATSEDPRVDYYRLHEKPTGDTSIVDRERWVGGTLYPLSERFARHLDDMLEAHECTPAAGDGWEGLVARLADLRAKDRTRFDDVRDRLIREQRPLAECVERCLFGRETLRAVGRLLHTSHSTVGRRTERGAMLLVAWCSDEKPQGESTAEDVA